MVRIVDEVLIQLGLDSKRFKSGLADGAAASSRFVDTLQKHSKAIAGLTVVSGLSFAAQAKFIEDVTAAAGEQELAIAKLESNLKAEQRTRSDSVKALTAQADALQKVTRFSDDQTIAAQAMLASFRLTDEQILQLTPRLQDVSENLAKLGDEEADLQKVALAFGKAIDTGNTAALIRYGIQIEKEKDGTIDFGKVIDQLANSSFAGLAEAVGETTQGRLAAFRNQINELQESIGFALLPTVNELITQITPAISKFSEWAKANGDVVLAIVGGGLAGSGLIAAVGALGVAITLFGSATGPIGLAILAISTLVGLFIKMRLEAAKVPGTLDEINQELDEQQKKANDLNTALTKAQTQGRGQDALGGGFAHSANLDAIQRDLDAAIKRIAVLQAAREKLAEPVPTPGAAIRPPDAVKDVEKAKERAKPDFEGDRDFVGPIFVSPLRRSLEGDAEAIEGFAATMSDIREQEAEADALATEQHLAQLERRNEALDAHAEHQAARVVDLAFAWGDMFARVLETEKNFAVAFGKATVLGLVKVLGAEARAAVAKILIEKAKELGKAAIGAPLSFGATLAAVGPIIAAAAAALGAISSIESKFGKSVGGFEQGGVIPRTAHFLMHEGEVVHNPRKNTTADLAANLARAGAGKEAALLLRGTGNTKLEATVNMNGPLNTQLDLNQAFKYAASRLARELGANTG